MSRKAILIIISIICLLTGWVLDAIAWTSHLGHPTSTRFLLSGLFLFVIGIVLFVIGLAMKRRD